MYITTKDHKFSLNTDFRVKSFNFYLLKGKKKIPHDYYFLRGSFKSGDVIPKLNFKFSMKIKRDELINQNNRMIYFRFYVSMEPTIGELHFDGDCLLESPEQHKITFFIQNVQPFKELICKTILKECYIHFDNIANKEKIPHLPINVFYTKHDIKGRYWNKV